MTKIATFTTSFFLPLLVGMLLCTSCDRNSDLDDNTAEKPGQTTVTLVPPQMESQTRGLSQAQEQRIDRIFVLVFDATGAVKVKAKSEGSNSCTFTSFEGSNLTIQVVANYSRKSDATGIDLETQLQNIETLNELKAVINKQSAIGAGDRPEAEAPARLLMTGMLSGEAISSGKAELRTIKMKYVAAKITVKIVDATPFQEVQMVGWDVVNVPAKSYLLGREVIEGSDTHDAVNPVNATDFYSTIGAFSWEKADTEESKKRVSQTIYIQENRRGGRRTDIPKPDKWTDEQFSSYRGKTLCAPAGASYLKLHYVCVKDGKRYVGELKVYLGGNNTNDYNVERGKYYTYTITIASISQITVKVDTDSNVDAIIAGEGDVVLRYDANGGSGAPAAAAYPPSTMVALPAEKPTMAGLEFLGWDTHPAGDGVRYQAEGTFSMPFKNTTLYAQYGLKLALEAGAGTVTPTFYEMKKGGTVTLPAATHEKLGFVKWTTSQDGSGTSYFAGQVFTMVSSSVTLYAQYGKYKLTFDVGAGTGIKSVELEAGGTYNLPAATPSSGQHFYCWRVDGTDYQAGTSYTMPAKEVTLTAVYAYQLSYNTQCSSPNPASVLIPLNGSDVVTSTVPTVGNGRFAGWNLSAVSTTDGTVGYKSGASISLTDNVTLYAQYDAVYLCGDTLLQVTARREPAPMSWKDANAYCSNLTIEGHSDWRLSTTRELSVMRLYHKDLLEKVPGFVGFCKTTTNSVGYYYWSSEYLDYNPNMPEPSAFFYLFCHDEGLTQYPNYDPDFHHGHGPAKNPCAVRCVRILQTSK